MKKLILALLFVLGCSGNVMAEYVAGYMTCQHDRGGDDYTVFIVKGKGANLNNPFAGTIAMSAFLNADYAVDTDKYCYDNEMGTEGDVDYFDKKSEANKHFSETINYYKNRRNIKKVIIIKNGYDEADWR